MDRNLPTCLYLTKNTMNTKLQIFTKSLQTNTSTLRNGANFFKSPNELEKARFQALIPNDATWEAESTVSIESVQDLTRLAETIGESMTNR